MHLATPGISEASATMSSAHPPDLTRATSAPVPFVPPNLFPDNLFFIFLLVFGAIFMLGTYLVLTIYNKLSKPSKTEVCTLSGETVPDTEWSELRGGHAGSPNKNIKIPL
ncbi:uncharacterized protein LOC144909998 [Branchiostoma floridae x Branchiostoma belcheri]